jgi:hypothetical protein
VLSKGTSIEREGPEQSRVEYTAAVAALEFTQVMEREFLGPCGVQPTSWDTV